MISALLAPLMAIARERGQNAEELLAGAGLQTSDLENPEKPIPEGACLRLWTLTAQALSDPGLPIAMARRMRLSNLELYGLTIAASPNARQSFGRSIRFSRLMTTSGSFALVEEAPLARIEYHRTHTLDLGTRMANESALACFLAGAREVLPIPVRVSSCSFVHPKPSQTRDHDAFFGVPVQWGASTNAFSFPAEVLNSPLPEGNAALLKYLDRQAEAQLAQSSTPGLVREVQHIIAQALSDGPPTAAYVAKALNMSERSLSRKLNEVSRSYAELLRDTRRTMAEDLLQRGTSITEIAFALGYSDTSAFSRAFRSWTGKSPSAYREA